MTDEVVTKPVRKRAAPKKKTSDQKNAILLAVAVVLAVINFLLLFYVGAQLR